MLIKQTTSSCRRKISLTSAQPTHIRIETQNRIIQMRYERDIYVSNCVSVEAKKASTIHGEIARLFQEVTASIRLRTKWILENNLVAPKYKANGWGHCVATVTIDFELIIVHLAVITCQLDKS